MKNKNKKITGFYVYLFLVILFFSFISDTRAIDGSAANIPSSDRQFKYTLLESFPGFFAANTEMTDFPALVLAIYKFGIWTVGIAGLFMLVVGGFMYLASAGNTSTASSAQGIISDALLGITAALGAYLILYVINPDLTKINLNFVPVNVSEEIKSRSTCSVGINACASSNMAIFGVRADEASMVCQGESRGNASSKSSLDVCRDGRSFSIGLFQINMIAHGNALGCDGVFEIRGTQTLQGDILGRTNGVPSKYDCNVKADKIAKYNECVQKLQNPEENKSFALSLRNSVSKWYPTWSAAKPCGF